MMDNLYCGLYIVVPFGSGGRQIARVLGPTRNPTKVRVRKWRANSRAWTQPLTIFRREILGSAGTQVTGKFRKELHRAQEAWA